MISMKQQRFPSFRREKVSCKGPLGAARGIGLGFQGERMQEGENLLQKVKVIKMDHPMVHSFGDTSWF